MESLFKVLGIAPHEVKPNVYSPSDMALKSAVKSKTDYDDTAYPNAYTGQKWKILVVGSEKDELEMQNGKMFYTGNHPVETFVPLLHLQKAGFDFDFATVNGNSMKLEMWAMPTEDTHVMSFYTKYKQQIEHPLVLKDVAANLNNSNYYAVFIPGGHGALLDLPTDAAMSTILNWTKNENKFLISICHGPAAFLAASTRNKEDFPYKGYKITAFNDSMDKILPTIGYLPGKLTWYFGKKLKDLGITIINKIPNGSVTVDRNLITGDSPTAANKLGRLAADTLLQQLSA